MLQPMNIPANAATIARQAAAGAIVGLSVVIYALSYGALLFSGPLSAFVGYGITIALITAVIGALYGTVSHDKAFISGPDSNTISVMASVLLITASMDVPAWQRPDFAVAMVVMASLISALVFYAVARADLSSVVRYIPFPVMAGFLASTGWLMTSGALNIIAATPLSRIGLQEFLSNPLRPELGVGGLVAASLFLLARRVSGAVLIPLVMVLATALVNSVLASGLCAMDTCRPDAWLFPPMGDLQWLAPWDLNLRSGDFAVLVQNIPDVLVLCFVGLLTILLSVASLELSFQREFDLNQSLKTHAALAGVSALLGGFVGIISIGRTTLNHQSGGGAIAGLVAAAIASAMLLGGGFAITYIPKAALGGLVLYLGLSMLLQWLWLQRNRVSRFELGQIVLILVLVANYGFLVGFSAGVVISCGVFIVAFSRVPLAELTTNLSVFSSSVVRSGLEAETLRQRGHNTVVFRLGGYVFFGSASKIDGVFRTMKPSGNGAIDAAVLDFTNVSGVDSSAISVFQRILRRYRDQPTQFYLVFSHSNEANVRAISGDAGDTRRIHIYSSLDRALEAAEEQLLEQFPREDECALFSDIFDSPDSREVFLAHCEIRGVSRGEFLCAEGDQSDALYFIASGSLEVLSSAMGSPALRLAKLQQGAMVGEMAFYSGEARTGSIVAVEDSDVYILRKEALATLRGTHPELATTFDHKVIRKISRDLSRTNQLVAMLH
jgi:SulP family sulfate permease